MNYIYNSTESEEEDDYDYEDYFGRCSCGNCVFIRDLHRCLCCIDIPEMLEKTENDYVSCITLHPAFNAVVLNPYVLETAFCGYHPNHDFDFDYRSYRYTAYRQLVRWCWGFLGKNKRKLLPSCAIAKIRKTFPRY
ncbi:hypothetical protein XENTR_v10019128 [Xenopus tropicalis]|uniref:P2X purinoceptor 7 n=1 Tax=Xenopus tropicalis TaxID=8364 RepID=A0A803K720_XENTR|nr:P2X purinoceptor 7 [Xenopus tropicalis]KAE8593428.1 hypothetical protein XENTR_v10019128 [Xenopus tropicalis]|eukprot:XP_002938323.1 PREDICTED: P2X purinoceptor 7-like [Xenopus tropicalis]